MAEGRTGGSAPRRTSPGRPALTQPGPKATSNGSRDQQSPRNAGPRGGTPTRHGAAERAAPGQRRDVGPARPGASLRAVSGPAPSTLAASTTSIPLQELYRGRNRLSLIRDLAMGEWSHRELAAQIGATPEAITAFANDHGDEISEVRAALAGHLAIETAGLWVSKKQNRLAEYQADIEDCERIVDSMRIQGPASSNPIDEQVFGGLGSRRHYNLMRTKLAIMKAVADELSPRAGITIKPGDDDDNGNTIRYIIEADDITGSLT